MNSHELNEKLRSNLRLTERVSVLKEEIAAREKEIRALNGQMRVAAVEARRTEITPGVCLSVKDLTARGHGYGEIASLFGISKATISLIVNDKYKTKRLKQGQRDV